MAIGMFMDWEGEVPDGALFHVATFDGNVRIFDVHATFTPAFQAS